MFNEIIIIIIIIIIIFIISFYYDLHSAVLPFIPGQGELSTVEI